MNLFDYPFWEKIRIYINKVCRRKPNYKRFHTSVQSTLVSNNLIGDAILSGKPFLIAKLGESELEVLRNYYAQKRRVNKNKVSLILDYLKFGDRYEWTGLNTIVKDSGFFPNDSGLLDRFSELYIECIKEIDYFATCHGLNGWYNNKGEDYILKWINSKAKIISTETLDPFLFLDTSWTKYLKGKRVLIIHPFEKSIKNNYTNRTKHFPIPLLPDFDLLTIRAVQSIAYSETVYSDWFEALQSMQIKIDSMDFDIALLGCGAYGLPLAAHIKNRNKQAIHIGGALQLYFGIMGNRWDRHPVISSYYNEYWTKPDTSEYPKQHHIFGNGDSAYW